MKGAPPAGLEPGSPTVAAPPSPFPPCISPPALPRCLLQGSRFRSGPNSPVIWALPPRSPITTNSSTAKRLLIGKFRPRRVDPRNEGLTAMKAPDPAPGPPADCPPMPAGPTPSPAPRIWGPRGPAPLSRTSVPVDVFLRDRPPTPRPRPLPHPSNENRPRAAWFLSTWQVSEGHRLPLVQKSNEIIGWLEATARCQGSSKMA